VRIRDAALIGALERLREAGPTLFSAPVDTIAAERVVERAFSTVVRARVSTGAGEVVVYCKTFRSPAGDPTSQDRLRFRVEREFRETARAWTAFDGVPGFAPVQPLAVYPDLLTIVTREVRGVPFSRLLANSARPWARSGLDATLRAASRVGEWLRRYHTIPSEPVQLSKADLREYVDTRLRRLEREHAGGFSAARRREIITEFDACAARMSPGDLAAVPVHADFCPENVLVHGDEVSVIDFAMAKQGLRHLDLSHLLIHLEFRRGLTWDARALRVIREAVLSGYAENGVTGSPAYRLAVLVHVAALMADRLNRATRLPAARNFWLAPQIRRCLDVVHA
jgi:hypothetical protein